MSLTYDEMFYSHKQDGAGGKGAGKTNYTGGSFYTSVSLTPFTLSPFFIVLIIIITTRVSGLCILNLYFYSFETHHVYVVMYMFNFLHAFI